MDRSGLFTCATPAHVREAEQAAVSSGPDRPEQRRQQELDDEDEMLYGESAASMFGAPAADSGKPLNGAAQTDRYDGIVSCELS